MTAKEYLQQLYRLNTYIEQKHDEIAALRFTLTGVASPDTSEERVSSGSVNGAIFESTIATIDEMEQEVAKELEKFVKLKHKIINQIQSLENIVYVKLLFKRYIEFKSLEQIAVEMNYSYVYVRKMHGYALNEFYFKNLKEATQ